MEKFYKLNGIAAPLDILNIDTDMIIPKQFLKTIKRSGLGKNLFDEMRYSTDGKEIKDFVLNKKPWNEAKIIIAGDNFGCGSSREHAPWALLDFGIKCVISTNFADIFYNNCFNNGLLPIVLTSNEIDKLLALSHERKIIEIDLENQVIFSEDSQVAQFEIDPFRKKCILEGLDEIGLSLTHSEQIKEFEKKRALDSPWIFINEKKNG